MAVGSGVMVPVGTPTPPITSYASVADYIAFWCLEEPTDAEAASIQTFLNLSAVDIDSALAGIGALDCTKEAWATTYLAKLNVIESAVVHQCPCGRTKISDDMRQAWLQWLDRQFELIRLQKIELCAGATTADFAAIGVAEYSFTDYNKALLIINRAMRTRG